MKYLGPHALLMKTAIGAGRSCLFAERAPRLVRLLEAVPLYVLLLDCEGDLDADSARPHLLAAGSTRLELFPEEHSLHGRYLREEVRARVCVRLSVRVRVRACVRAIECCAARSSAG